MTVLSRSRLVNIRYDLGPGVPADSDVSCCSHPYYAGMRVKESVYFQVPVVHEGSLFAYNRGLYTFRKIQ